MQSQADRHTKIMTFLKFQAIIGLQTDEEETLLQKVLQMAMDKVLAAIPTDDPAFRPAPTRPIDINEPYASFPSLPRIRDPRPYEADEIARQNDDRHAEILCNKKGYSHGSLSRGKINTGYANLFYFVCRLVCPLVCLSVRCC